MRYLFHFFTFSLLLDSSAFADGITNYNACICLLEPERQALDAAPEGGRSVRDVVRAGSRSNTDALLGYLSQRLFEFTPLRDFIARGCPSLGDLNAQSVQSLQLEIVSRQDALCEGGGRSVSPSVHFTRGRDNNCKIGFQALFRADASLRGAVDEWLGSAVKGEVSGPGCRLESQQQSAPIAPERSETEASPARGG